MNEEKDLSKTVITGSGIAVDENKVEVPCPTCKRKGRVPDPKYFGIPMGYCAPNGDRVPHIPCRTCNGEGWILIDKKDLIK